MRCGDIWWIVFAYKCIEIILHFYLCFSLLSSYQDPCMILFKIYIRKMFVAWLQDCFIDARHYAVTLDTVALQEMVFSFLRIISVHFPASPPSFSSR